MLPSTANTAYVKTVWRSKLQLLAKILWCTSTQSIEHMIITLGLTLNTDA